MLRQASGWQMQVFIYIKLKEKNVEWTARSPTEMMLKLWSWPSGMDGSSFQEEG